MTKDTKNKTELALLVIMGVLIIFSGVQAYELTTLKSDIASGEITPAANAPTTQSTANNQVQRLQDLPQMVGGC